MGSKRESAKSASIVRQLSPTRSRTVDDWLERAASLKTRKQYERTLKYWVAANGFTSARYGVDQIRSGRADVYDSSDRMVKHLVERTIEKTHRKMSPSSIDLHRGHLPLLFEFLTPKLDFDRKEYDRAVRKVEVYKISEDKVPTRDEARRVLIQAPNHKPKAFVAIAINTGRRLGEIRSLKVKDVDFTTKPIRIYFRAKTTKTKKEAMGFLTPEAAELVQAYLRYRGFENQWLFPGSQHIPARGKHPAHNAPLDKPMANSNAWAMVMECFKAAGLGDKDDNDRNVYHPHMLRTYALNHMRSAGLNETMAKQIVGHDTGVEEFYKDWEEIAKSWKEKCEQEFTLLSDTRVLEKVKVETEMAKAQSEQLKGQFTELREAVETYRARGNEALETITELLNRRNARPTDLSPIIKPMLDAEEGVARVASDLATVSGKTQKFSNHVFDYVKTSIETRDFDEALMEGYERYMEDPKTGLIVLRKSKIAVQAAS